MTVILIVTIYAICGYLIRYAIKNESDRTVLYTGINGPEIRENSLGLLG